MTDVIRQPRVNVSDEGTPQGRAATLNFTGAGVTASVSGDTATVNITAGGGSFSMTEIEIDFGTTPQWGKTFTVVDGTVSGASMIACWPSGNVATSRVGNDYEWDMVMYTALAGTGEFTLTAMAFPGPIVGKRKVYYAIA